MDVSVGVGEGVTVGVSVIVAVGTGVFVALAVGAGVAAVPQPAMNIARGRIMKIAVSRLVIFMVGFPRPMPIAGGCYEYIRGFYAFRYHRE